MMKNKQIERVGLLDGQGREGQEHLKDCRSQCRNPEGWSKEITMKGK